MHLTSLDSRPVRALPAAVAGMLAAPLPVQASEELVLLPDPGVMLVLLVVFVAAIYPLNRLILQPLMKVMDAREERIEGARSRAAAVQQQAEDALRGYQESILAAHDEASADRRRRVNEAREQLLGITSQAKEEAEREIARARQELSASVVEARSSLREAAAGLASLAAERILGRSLAE